jgi:hypothetical protein
MRDRVVIMAGLLIFLVLLTCPFWYAPVAGQGPPPPDLKPPQDGSHCVRQADWMKANHTKLLKQWRDEVVRGDGPVEPYRSSDYPEAEPYEKSLTKTCLKCHTMEAEPNGKRSCAQCHDYADIQPRCMDCHLEPKGI